MLQFQSCVNNIILKQAYEEIKETTDLPQVLKHSSLTPMPIEMTASLLRIKQLLLKENENEQQKQILLKAGSLEIIRFISQLADMYTTQSKDKNKSVNQILKQENLSLDFPDILSEMRHALTHKDIPDKKLIISTINYILNYLEKNYWNIKLKEQSPILQIRANIKHLLDSLNEDDYTVQFEIYDQYSQQQQQIIVIFCFDYLIGLSDFHIVQKSTEQRLKDRRVGDQRIKMISKFTISLIQFLYNNKNTNHVKRQLARKQYICNDDSFIKLYNKLNVIGFIKTNIRDFIIDLEQELPELKQKKNHSSLELNQKIDKLDESIEQKLEQIVKKPKLIGSLYCDYVNNINNSDEI
ncbi:unnamed protein product [Paramecium sonneborni]|uniref:Uncharacterized protein n=1 Tax=Paramecium sonneborni TaxID=65129 RepID=A0A8S1K5R0_9CILI|nr:unnamed protein product [Paramecium sonneborni]